ncbi:hypothetical protein [Siphonobacter sp. SORGH_AS_0500]|uniref:hypothetical protein n=1 Tax=Siphonobacter sp. SORGH_AS_0500 TaxID=1864824 RepID=UPI00286105AF|nr:hypothetical protein [Siphonobacter sp. SORGH_AS_0500]MDR6194713.1 hypothetical protein [Siphonobacter sp. SORGH_AS_0500]
MRRLWIKYKEIVLVFSAIAVLIALVAGVQTCRSINKIGDRIADKIEKETSPTVVVHKYDSVTANKIIQIEVERKLDHARVDSLRDTQLQAALDSVFNYRRR